MFCGLHDRSLPSRVPTSQGVPPQVLSGGATAPLPSGEPGRHGIGVAASPVKSVLMQAMESDDDGIDRAAGGRRAFLLEDNDVNALLLTRFLTSIDYDEVVLAKSLEQARSHKPDILKGDFDLVVLDIMLPDGISIDLLKELKFRRVPRVCVYTARVSPSERAEYFQSGCDAILEKPILFDTFKEQHDLLFQA